MPQIEDEEAHGLLVQAVERRVFKLTLERLTAPECRRQEIAEDIEACRELLEGLLADRTGPIATEMAGPPAGTVFH